MIAIMKVMVFYHQRFDIVFATFLFAYYEKV